MKRINDLTNVIDLDECITVGTHWIDIYVKVTKR